MKTYKKSVSRENSLIGTQAWNIGDTIELKKWLNWNFKRHYFVNNNGMVNLFYEKQEGDTFYDKLAKKLLEKEFLDSLCKNFINNVNKGRKISKKELNKEEIIELFDTTVKCWPAVTIFDQISNSPEIVKNKIIDRLLKIRKEYGEFMYEVSSIILNSIVKIYPQLEGFEDSITIEEFKNGNLPSREKLEKRKKYYILYNNFLELNKSLQELSKEHGFEIVDESKREIENKVKGNIAMRGKAKGKVKIILRIEDINKVEKGDILIASMTTPDHIIAMDKAGAFVTDEGGIACHAAIIAREFQKPCIVGTGNATKVFKDDDLVFVDADSGIVRKII